MKPLKQFDEFLDNGTIRQITPDNNRAKSLARESVNRMKFLESVVKSIGITDENANYIVENSYDAIMERIRSAMLKEGLSSSGLGAHEAEVSYSGRLGLSEHEIRFLNELRYRRNGILYYGEDCLKNYALETYEFAKKIIGKING